VDELMRLSKTEAGLRALSRGKFGHSQDFAHLINKICAHSRAITHGRLRVYAVRVPSSMRDQSYIFEQMTLFITFDEYACGEKRNIAENALTFFDGRFNETVISGVAGKLFYILLIDLVSNQL
jgi:hypothetical protein